MEIKIIFLTSIALSLLLHANAKPFVPANEDEIENTSEISEQFTSSEASQDDLIHLSDDIDKDDLITNEALNLEDDGDILTHFQPQPMQSEPATNSGRVLSKRHVFTNVFPQSSFIVPDISVTHSRVNSNQVPDNIVPSGKLNLPLRAQFQTYDSNFNKFNAKLKKFVEELDNTNDRISQVDSDAKQQTRLSNEDNKEATRQLYALLRQLGTKTEEVENYAVQAKMHTDDNFKKVVDYIKDLYVKIDEQGARTMTLIQEVQGMATHPLSHARPVPVHVEEEEFI